MAPVARDATWTTPARSLHATTSDPDGPTMAGLPSRVAFPASVQLTAPVMALREMRSLPEPTTRVVPSSAGVVIVPEKFSDQYTAPVVRSRATVWPYLLISYATPSENPLTPGGEMVIPPPTS